MINPCGICSDEERDHSQICVVAQVSDLWAIERTGSYNGVYFVLGGVLSALDGIGPEDLGIERLLEQIEQGNVCEVILALSATVNGQATGHTITDRLEALKTPEDLKISRLAHGVPIGGELDYLDEGTITTALKKRTA
jgi:recombination protein RecR